MEAKKRKKKKPGQGSRVGGQAQQISVVSLPVNGGDGDLRLQVAFRVHRRCSQQVELKISRV